MIVPAHTFLGIVALIAGAWNLLARKGTRLHRLVGWIYAGSMILLIFTSFFIFDLFGGFGPYHAMALVSGGALVLALYFPLRRRYHQHWLRHHYMWITFSYVGLVMATGSHFFAYLSSWPFWSRAVLFWGLPYVVGSLLIYGQRKRILETTRKRIKAKNAA